MPYGKNSQVGLPVPACCCTGTNSTPQHLGHAWHVFLCALLVSSAFGVQRMMSTAKNWFYRSHDMAVEVFTGKSRDGMLHVALHVVQNLSERHATLHAVVLSDLVFNVLCAKSGCLF